MLLSLFCETSLTFSGIYWLDSWHVKSSHQTTVRLGECFVFISGNSMIMDYDILGQ